MSNSKKKQMSQEEFVSKIKLEGVTFCPFCSSSGRDLANCEEEPVVRIGKGNWEHDGEQCAQVETCLKCGKSWWTVYTVIGYEEIKK